MVDNLPPQVKPTDEFYRMRNSANQRRNECKQCCDASRALRVVETPTVAQKLCKKCGMVRAADCFFRCRRDVTGLQAYCRDCKKVMHSRLPVCTDCGGVSSDLPPLCLAAEVLDPVIFCCSQHAA